MDGWLVSRGGYKVFSNCRETIVVASILACGRGADAAGAEVSSGARVSQTPTSSVSARVGLPAGPSGEYCAGPMIGYVTLGTNNLERAAAFYDALLGELGARRAMQFPRFILWGTGPGAPGIAVCLPYDGQPATVGNGGMVAIAVGSREDVDRLHARALALGGTDEGAPGARGPTFYAAYFRDLDGNKLNFFKMG